MLIWLLIFWYNLVKIGSLSYLLKCNYSYWPQKEHRYCDKLTYIQFDGSCKLSWDLGAWKMLGAWAAMSFQAYVILIDCNDVYQIKYFAFSIGNMILFCRKQRHTLKRMVSSSWKHLLKRRSMWMTCSTRLVSNIWNTDRLVVGCRVVFFFLSFWDGFFYIDRIY